MASAETLSDIDREIQKNRSFRTNRGSLDAYNIYKGVTNARLDRKINILQGTSVNTNFYQSQTGVRNYSNFYSFTSRAGVTDTKLEIVTTNSTLRLYRRSDSAYKEASSYLGSWWSGKYRGINASRDELAVLAAWGSDLQRIYVVDVPAGQTLVGGLASPMEEGGEYRRGGAYQYYFRGAPSSWLVYALFAPDYLKSYSGAVTSAQKVGRSIVNDLGLHLSQTRYAVSNNPNASGEDANAQEGEFWLSGFGGNLDYSEIDGSSVNSQIGGMSLGWQKLISDQNPGNQPMSWFGLMFSHGINVQEYDISHVKNDTAATVGGIYGLYMQNPQGPHSWYGSCSLLAGRTSFYNTVPGELGYGLNQDYDGNIAILTVENGISFKQKNGWSFEPQLQLSYTKIYQSDFNDKLGARVSLDQGDSFWGRLGLEVRKTLSNTPFEKVSLWTRFSYIQDFSDPNRVNVSGDLAVSELKQNSYVLALGTDIRLSNKWYLQCQVEEFLGGEQGLQGNLALKCILD